MEINLTPGQRRRLDDSISLISDHDMIRQSIKLKENEGKLQEILLRESVQLDIKSQAKEMAGTLWQQK